MSLADQYFSRWNTQFLVGIVANSLLYAAFVLLLAVVFLTQVTHPPAAVTGWRVAILFVMFGLLAMSVDMLERHKPESWYGFIAILAAGVLLIESLSRYRIETFGPDGPNTVLLLLVFSAILVFAVAYPDPRRFLDEQWLFIGAFALVIGLFFVHIAGTGAAPTWPVWASVVAAVSLVVVPRFVPENLFLWTVSIFAAVSAGIAILSFIFGEFALPFAEVELWPQTVPLIGSEIEGWYAHTSIYHNVNVFGLVAFAGLAGSLFLVHRSVVSGTIVASSLAALLLVVNGIGLLLSSSGAAWISAGVVIGFYLPYVALGRKAIIPTFVFAIFGAAIVTVAAYYGHIVLDDSGRFARWESGIRAFRDGPELFGHGHISTAEFTAPYFDGSPDEPHNSYLDILIRTGFVGLLAYTVLLLGGLLSGLIRYRTVNVAMLALTFGWAFHHLFESYTMIQWTIPAVLSAMTLGYLLFSPASEAETATTTTFNPDPPSGP